MFVREIEITSVQGCYAFCLSEGFGEFVLFGVARKEVRLGKVGKIQDKSLQAIVVAAKHQTVLTLVEIGAGREKVLLFEFRFVTRHVMSWDFRDGIHSRSVLFFREKE